MLYYIARDSCLVANSQGALWCFDVQDDVAEEAETLEVLYPDTAITIHELTDAEAEARWRVRLPDREQPPS